MEHYSEPYRIHAVVDAKTRRRLHRFREKAEAEVAFKRLKGEGKDVALVVSRCYFVDLYRPGRGGSHRSTHAKTLEAAKRVVAGWQEEAIEERRSDKPHLRPLGFEEAARGLLAWKELTLRESRSLDQYRQIFEQRLIPAFRDSLLDEIELQALEQYFKRRQRESRNGKLPSPRLLNMERTLVRQLYRWAIAHRHALYDPTLGLPRFREDVPDVRILDAEEAAALLPACREPYRVSVVALRNAGGRKGGIVKEKPSTFEQTVTPPEWLYDIVVLALTTGLRLGNLVNLEWDQVDLKRRRIDIRGGGMKNRRPMTVFLNEDAHEVLERRFKNRSLGSKRVFEAIDNRVVARSFEKAVKRAGIKKCRFHDLRKTCASWLAAAGVNLNAVMAVTGHRTLNVTLRHYLNVTEAQRREAVERIKLPGA